MRLTLLVPTLLVVSLAGVYGAGSALPEERTTIRGAQYRVPRDIIWQMVSDVKATGSWDKDIAEIRTIPDPESNYGNLWHLEYTNGQYSVLRVKNLPEQFLQQREIVDASTLPPGQWNISAVENNKGTFIKINATAKTKNPWMRFLRHYVLSSDTEIRYYLEGLAAHYDTKITIQELAV